MKPEHPVSETRVELRAHPRNPDLVIERVERLTTDALVTRRDYLKILAVLSGGLAAGSLAVAAGAFERRTEGAHNRMVITEDASSVPIGGQIRFGYPTADDPAMLIRLGPQHWVAYSAVCTHLSCEVLWKAADHELFCPCHNGHFSVATGAPTGGPPQRPLPEIRLEHQGNTILAVGEGRIRTTP